MRVTTPTIAIETAFVTGSAVAESAVMEAAGR